MCHIWLCPACVHCLPVKYESVKPGAVDIPIVIGLLSFLWCPPLLGRVVVSGVPAFTPLSDLVEAEVEEEDGDYELEEAAEVREETDKQKRKKKSGSKTSCARPRRPSRTISNKKLKDHPRLFMISETDDLLDRLLRPVPLLRPLKRQYPRYFSNSI